MRIAPAVLMGSLGLFCAGSARADLGKFFRHLTHDEPSFPEMREVDVDGDLPAWALRGPHASAERYVFLGGICSHPLGYAQSIARSAAEHGELLAVQGDAECAGPLRKWSYDLDGMKRRIDAAFAAARIEERDVTLIGYSQGAERAEKLAARYPETFTRVVLIASPVVPSPARLRHVKGAVLMAGTRDAQKNMREGLTALRAAHIPTTFIALPNARHGQMGDDPEGTFREVFAWLAERAP